MSHRSQKFQAWPFITSSWISPHSLRNAKDSAQFLKEPQSHSFVPKPQEKNRNKLWTTQLEHMFFSSFMPLVACSGPIQTTNLYGFAAVEILVALILTGLGTFSKSAASPKVSPAPSWATTFLSPGSNCWNGREEKSGLLQGESNLATFIFQGLRQTSGVYCWWKKFCITSDVWNLNGRHYLSTGAGFLLATVLNIEVMFKVKTI